MSDRKLQVIPLGGLGEFGMNSMAFRYGDDIIVVDAGMMFPDAELLGVDIVTPDFAYLKENRKFVRGLVLTHGHEDHIGGIPFLLSEVAMPIYGTALTLALVERRLEEHKIDADLRIIKANDKIKLGPFEIEFIHVTHSVSACVAIAITTPIGVIIHTGDFKIDLSPLDNQPFDLHKFAEYGKRGVLLLLSDSTNVDRPGFTPSEKTVRPGIEELVRNAERRVIVSCFSSSTHRLQMVLDIAAATGRKVGLLGRSMLSTTEIAHSLGLLRIPDSILLRPQDIMLNQPEKTLVLVSGTQGEPMSALSRVSCDSHKSMKVEKGDTVIFSSRIIPGNEKPIMRVINHLARRNANIYFGSRTPHIHVSGHASSEELKLLLNLVRPKYFVPLHGEYWQLRKHIELANGLKDQGLEQSFLMETGESLVIDSKGARYGERVAVGRVCIDSGSLDDVVEDLVIRDRRHLAEDGFVLPIIAIDKLTGKLEGRAEIITRGFIAEDNKNLITGARAVLARTLETSSAEERSDVGVMQEKIRADLKRYLSKETQRRPLIMPVILEV